MKTSVPRMFSSIWNETSVSGKSAQPRLPHRHAQELRDLPGEPRMGAAGEHLEIPEARLWHRQSAHAARHRSRGRAFRCGWGGRIRTFEYGFQRPAPYRLATPQYRLAACQAAAGSPRPATRPGGRCVWRGSPRTAETPSVYERFSRRQARGGASSADRRPRQRPGVHRPHAPAGQRRPGRRRRPRRRGTRRRPPSRCRTSPRDRRPAPSACAPAGRWPGGGGRRAPPGRCAVRRPRPATIGSATARATRVAGRRPSRSNQP